MKTILCINFVFWALSSFCQDNFWNEKGAIVSKYTLMQTNDSTFQFKTTARDDNFTILITGSDSLRINHFFQSYSNGSINDESLCDSLVIELLCSNCKEGHLNTLIHSKERKWLKLSDSLYISRKSVSKFWPTDKSPNKFRVPIMEIHPGNIMTRIIIHSEILTKEEWKALKSHAID
jgi:hypothetical protein